MEVGIRVETEYSRSYTEDIILDIDIIQIWNRLCFSRPLSAPFLFRTSGFSHSSWLVYSFSRNCTFQYDFYWGVNALKIHTPGDIVSRFQNVVIDF